MKIHPNNRVLLLSIALVGCSVLWFLGGLPEFSLDMLSMTKGASQNQLRMLLYNLWFSHYKMEERMKAIAKIIDELKPNIITLNEVTKENLAMLTRQAGLAKYKVVPTDDLYKTMPADLPKLHLHTTAILTDLPVISWEAFRFKYTEEGRRLVIAELRIPIYEKVQSSNGAKLRNVSFVSAVAHFEYQKKSAVFRAEQLKKSIESISIFENACFSGDLNNRVHIDGNLMLPNPWQDLWMTLPGNTHENGYTWDNETNPLIKSKSKGRNDRFLCKLSDFKAESAKIVGNKELSPGVFPSDHFGLFVVLVPKVHEVQHGQGQPSFKRPAAY